MNTAEDKLNDIIEAGKANHEEVLEAGALAATDMQVCDTRILAFGLLLTYSRTWSDRSSMISNFKRLFWIWFLVHIIVLQMVIISVFSILSFSIPSWVFFQTQTSALRVLT